MNMNEYQDLASRTINHELTRKEQGKHALSGMVSEVGEIHALYQKKYQGHPFNEEHAKEEVGDLLWMIAEYCTAHNWNLGSIAVANIEKLKKRYPNGFDPERSIHREEYGNV